MKSMGEIRKTLYRDLEDTGSGHSGSPCYGNDSRQWTFVSNASTAPRSRWAYASAAVLTHWGVMTMSQTAMPIVLKMEPTRRVMTNPSGFLNTLSSQDSVGGKPTDERKNPQEPIADRIAITRQYGFNPQRLRRKP